MSFVTIDGRKTFYLALNSPSAAKGKTILFVHGAWANLRMWFPQVEFFSRDHTTIALDLPGHGDSKGEAYEDIGAYREFVKAFADKLGLEQFIFCGHSMGTAIGMEVAFHYPQRIQGLVMVDGAARYTGGSNEVLELMERDPERGLLEIRKLVRRVADASSAELSQPLTEKDRAFFTVAYKDMKALRHPGDFTPLLDKINKPTVIIIGENDHAARDLTPALLAIRGSRLEVIPKAGHVPSIDNPEAVNAVINKLIRSLDTSA